MRARPLLRAVAGAAVAAGLVTALGCSKEVVPGTKAGGTTTTAPAPRAAVLGEEVTYSGVELVVVDITSSDRSPDGVPRIRVVVRSENVDDTERQNPAMALRCAESPTPGDWFRGSTWEPGQLLPAGAVSEGIVLVGFPAKADAPLYNVVACTDARIEVELGGPGEAHVRLDYAVPPEVVTESIERPRGKVLPLPLETR